MPALGRLAGDLEPDLADFGRGRALYVLDLVELEGGRFAGFGRAVGVLDFGVVLGAVRFAGFGRAVGVLDLGVVLGPVRFAGFGRAVGVLGLGVVRAVGRFAASGRARGAVDLGDGLEAVGCSRVCRGRAILR